MLSSRTAFSVPRSAILVCLALVAPLAIAADTLSNVEVSFGRGLNTAQPGNRVNHAVLPQDIKVKAGGVVDFGIAGFHDIIIFKPGVRCRISSTRAAECIRTPGSHSCSRPTRWHRCPRMSPS